MGHHSKKHKHKRKHHKKHKSRKNGHHYRNRNRQQTFKLTHSQRERERDKERKTNAHSYSPTVNKDLITMKSIPRKELFDCNIHKAFRLEEPLQIGIPIKGSYKCYEYYKPEAIRFLLHNLSADKHINPALIVPPKQSHSNCWFNALFVTFFVSDKGRKFFHFLRQLMIEGKQGDGSAIPDKLRGAFALLNFGVDACLTGNEYAYTLNTNSIIHLLYKAIPHSYREKNPIIVDVDKAGNPLLYYMSIIRYLQNTSIQLLFITNAKPNWKETVSQEVTKLRHLPHIIVLEIFDNVATEFNKKPLSFTVNEAKYKIDSTVVRDITKQHFCATLTCEGNEMGYDGMSFHRLIDMKWKHQMNTNATWQFEGTKNHDGTPLQWNFMKSYQMLIYYRV